MTKGNINISVSGGKSEFGNIVQGDKNKTSIFQTNALEDFYSSIAELQKMQGVTARDVAQLKHEIEALTQNTEENDLIDRMKAIYEKYAWAIEPLKKLFSIIVP